MTKQFIASAFISLSACALLSGCASEPTCDYSEEPYMAATSVPPLTVPEGMSSPDRTATLVVPPAPEGDRDFVVHTVEPQLQVEHTENAVAGGVRVACGLAA